MFCLDIYIYIVCKISFADYRFSQIPTNGAGLIEYRCHPFWSQKYCPSHDYDETARCCSCERLEVKLIYVIYIYIFVDDLLMRPLNYEVPECEIHITGRWA